mgnify:CR=1 FL=1
MGKKVDGRADLFSPGVVLYQLCSSNLPFKGESMATLMYSIVNDPPADLVRDTDIESTIRELSGSLGETVSHLVNVANASGGKDNISVVLVRTLKPFSDGRGLFQKIINWFE